MKKIVMVAALASGLSMASVQAYNLKTLLEAVLWADQDKVADILQENPSLMINDYSKYRKKTLNTSILQRSIELYKDTLREEYCSAACMAYRDQCADCQARRRTRLNIVLAIIGNLKAQIMQRVPIQSFSLDLLTGLGESPETVQAASAIWQLRARLVS